MYLCVHTVCVYKYKYIHIYEIMICHVLFIGMCILLEQHCMRICNIKTAIVLDAGKHSHVLQLHYEK
jgi:hypothetical protein